MILNKPKTNNMWLLDARDANQDMSKLTYRDAGFIPSFRNPLPRLSLAHFRAKNKTQYIYQFGFSCRQVTQKRPQEVTKELYIRSITDKTQIFKNLHKELNKNQDNYSRLSYSHNLIQSTLADYRGNVYTNASDLDTRNEEDNVKFFTDAITNIFVDGLSASRRKVLNEFLTYHSNKSHTELESLGYEHLSIWLSKFNIEANGRTYYGVVHDEDSSFNKEYLIRTLYLDFSSGIPIPKFKTEEILFDITYYNEDASVYKKVTHTASNPLICYYLASVAKKRNLLLKSSSQYNLFKGAVNPITLKCNKQIIPHVEKYYTWKEEEDIKDLEDKIAEEKDSKKIKEYSDKIDSIERTAKNRNSTKVASYWRWMDVNAYNVDDLPYLGERTIASLKHKDYDLYQCFEDLNSEDGDKVTNSSILFGSRIATRDDVSNFYNYHFFKYIYDKTPEYQNNQKKRIEFVFGTDGIASSISFDRIEKAVFSDKVKPFYNKRKHKGVEHKVLPCRVKRKEDGTYGFYSRDDETDSIDELLDEYIIRSYTTSTDISRFLEHYLSIPIAFVFCNSNEENTCYVVHNGMSTIRSFHHHNDAELSENPIHEATTDLDVRCKIPFAAEFLAVFGKNHRNQPALTEEEIRYSELAKKQETQETFESSVFKSNAECIYSYQYSYSSSRVICLSSCSDSCSLLPLIPDVINKISTIDQLEFIGNFAHIFSLVLSKIERKLGRWASTLGDLLEIATIVMSYSNPVTFAAYLATKAFVKYVVPKILQEIAVETTNDPHSAKIMFTALNTLVSLAADGYNFYKNYDKLTNFARTLAVGSAAVNLGVAVASIVEVNRQRHISDQRKREEMARRVRDREMKIKRKKLDELVLFDVNILASELARVNSLDIRLLRNHESSTFIENSYEYLSQSLDTTRTLSL